MFLSASGTDGLPLDRCDYDPAAPGGLDPSPCPARCRLLPDTGGPLDQLGRGHEGPLLVFIVLFSYGTSLFWLILRNPCNI